MARRRKFSVFSLSFLDIMSCGFGAVVLIFLIINHATETTVKEVNRDVLAELRMLDYQVLTGEKNLVEEKKQLDERLRKLEETRIDLAAMDTTLQDRVDTLDQLDAETLAKIENVNKLKSDIEVQQEEIKRLRAAEAASAGGNVSQVEGEGDRQYLTGLKVGGKRIVIAVDVSASMLDSSLVNIIRRRNMSEEKKLAAPKWQRTVATVEWLIAQLPIASQFQILAYNTTTDSLVSPGDFSWKEIDGSNILSDTIDRMRTTIPADGTSLENLFIAIGKMNPIPDNLYLIADGLPTQGTKPPRATTVTGKRRLQLFGSAVQQLPSPMTVNVIMFPMEGDPSASAAYWNLALVRDGAYLSPSRDWP